MGILPSRCEILSYFCNFFSDLGDDTRRWGPPFIESENGTKESCYFLSVNRNKKSLAINFQTEKGRDILTQLAMKSDVLLENFVPGKLAKLGLDYDSLKCRPCHFILIYPDRPNF